MSPTRRRFMVSAAAVAGSAGLHASEAAGAPGGWTAGAPREEIRPRFSVAPRGGRGGRLALCIEADNRPGLDGYWHRTFPVTGGKHYRFSVYRKADSLAWPQRSAVVKIRWQDEAGKRVLDDRPLVQGALERYVPYAPLEHPVETGRQDQGWAEVGAVYQAPGGAQRAVVELHLLWARNGKVAWSDPLWEEVPAPAPRPVRLAAVHFQPRQGRLPEEKRVQFAPFIAEAARQRAHLAVLPETLTYYGTDLSPAELAEPVPGPSSQYFAELARQHNLYIVAGLFERDGPAVYNVAVLLSPEGRVAGKYRKVTIPDSEVERGVAAGGEYPVFETSFGKLGMMICYDGFFPEVARELVKRGAEVIAWPVWGCNPVLAEARAAENHVVLVSSTYEPLSSNWMLTAIWDRSGKRLATAADWGTVVVAEVDLNSITRWKSLGDFRSKIRRHAPMTGEQREYR